MYIDMYSDIFLFSSQFQVFILQFRLFFVRIARYKYLLKLFSHNYYNTYNKFVSSNSDFFPSELSYKLLDTFCE